MERVLVTDECWLWQGSLDRHGRGRIKVGGRNGRIHLVHRFLDELRNGPIPAGTKVLHRCDTPSCVRPDHLFRGTQRDNVADMDRKGRGRRYFTAWRSLTFEQVEEILASGESSRVLAERFPVSARTIRKIRAKGGYRQQLAPDEASGAPPWTLGRKGIRR